MDFIPVMSGDLAQAIAVMLAQVYDRMWSSMYLLYLLTLFALTYTRLWKTCSIIVLHFWIILWGAYLPCLKLLCTLYLVIQVSLLRSSSVWFAYYKCIITVSMRSHTVRIIIVCAVGYGNCSVTCCYYFIHDMRSEIDGYMLYVSCIQYDRISNRKSHVPNSQNTGVIKCCLEIIERWMWMLELGKYLGICLKCVATF